MESVYGTNLSFFPWIKRHGHVTSWILCSLWNPSLRKGLNTKYFQYLAGLFKEVNGLNKIKAATSFLVAKNIPGPPPSDLP